MTLSVPAQNNSLLTHSYTTRAMFHKGENNSLLTHSYTTRAMFHKGEVVDALSVNGNKTNAKIISPKACRAKTEYLK